MWSIYRTGPIPNHIKYKAPFINEIVDSKTLIPTKGLSIVLLGRDFGDFGKAVGLVASTAVTTVQDSSTPHGRLSISVPPGIDDITPYSSSCSRSNLSIKQQHCNSILCPIHC